MMLKVGLTGGIGSGKSTVSCIFKQLKIPVYQADIEARKLMHFMTELKDKIISLLGEQSYINGELNKHYIASIVFSDAEKLKKLNEIVHPFVRRDFHIWAEKHQDSFYIIEEAAILFESGHYKDFDFTVLVTASEELRIRRVVERDSVERNHVIKRIKHQMPEKEKLERSDFIIYNNEDDLILPQVLELHNKFISLQNKKSDISHG